MPQRHPSPPPAAPGPDAPGTTATLGTLTPNESAVQQRREELRRSLSRVNTAGVAVVLVTLALALAAALSAARAGRQTRLAREATEQAREQLWQSYRAQAHAGRLSRVVGSRSAGLAAIAAAAGIRPSLELRNEAIAHLALLDFEPTEISWTNQPHLGHSQVTPLFARFLESDGYGSIRLTPIRPHTGTNANPHPNPGSRSAPNAESTPPPAVLDRAAAVVLRSTNGQLQSVSFSTNELELAVVHGNRHCAVWDLPTRTNLWTLDGVIAARHSPDGQHLLILHTDHTARLLEARSGRETARVHLENRATMAAFGPDGTEVAIAAQSRVHLWNWQTGATREPLETDHPVRSLAWHGHLLAAGDGAGEVRVWNLLTQRSRRLQAHQNNVHHVFFDPRGEALVSTSYDGSTKVWDPRTGQLLLVTSLGFATHFSPDGSRIAFGTQSGWSLWRVIRPAALTTLDCATGPTLNVWHTDFSPDGRWIAATKDDGVLVFSVATGRRVLFHPIAQARTALFLPGNTNLLTTSTRRIALWPIRSGAGAPPSPGESTLPTTGPNPAAASAGFELGGRELITLAGISRLESGALSADRRQLILPVSPTAAALVDLESRRERMRFTNAILPKLSAISPDGRWVATGTFHGYGLELWDASTGERLRQFRDGNCSAYFSPDGRHLVSAGSSHYRIHETGTWQLQQSIPRESGSDLPNLAAFTPDSRLMAVIKQLNRIELLTPGSWDTVAALVPPDPQVVTWPAFSPTASHLAVATAQNLVQLWNLAELRQHLAPLGLDWLPGQPHPATPTGASSNDASSAGPPAAPDVTPAVPSPVSSASAGSAGSAVSRGSPSGLGWPTALDPADPDGWPRLLGMLSVALLVVIGCAIFIRHRQRRLLEAYVEMDSLAESQRVQLLQAQAELIHSQKMKALGTLAAGIAHDFNNLLSVIRMSNQLTGEAARAHAEIQENVGEVEQAVQQGKKLVRSMLGYSREEAGDGAFGLPELIEETVALLSKQFLSGITLTLELDRDLPPARGSRSRLEQILLNLVVNATEAMNGSGSLHIRALAATPTQLPAAMFLRPATANAYLELRLADSGPGISPETLPRIFEPFFTTKHRGAHRGTGLGLSTVYSMAEQDGLGLAVSSTPGQGACFHIFLPVHTP